VRQLVIPYCVIAGLLNGVLGASRVLWREVAYNHGLVQQIIPATSGIKFWT
jgi:hypothetical protein